MVGNWSGPCMRAIPIPPKACRLMWQCIQITPNSSEFRLCSCVKCMLLTRVVSNKAHYGERWFQTCIQGTESITEGRVRKIERVGPGRLGFCYSIPNPGPVSLTNNPCFIAVLVNRVLIKKIRFWRAYCRGNRKTHCRIAKWRDEYNVHNCVESNWLKASVMMAIKI